MTNGLKRFSDAQKEDALEGEGDLTLRYWRREHRRFFTEDLARAGQQFSEDMKVVCEEFEKVYPPDN